MMVNGTEDVALEWDAVDWRLHEDNVRRLRRRIFKAAKEGDLATVRSLQKMMLRSWPNTPVSVRQVAQRNTGRETAGIDGEVALTAPARMALAVRVHQSIRTWKPVPVKRVYVPKANAKLRRSAFPC
jgi:RNA-directed DNA polymerase